MTYELNPLSDLSTGDADVTREDVLEAVNAFNRVHDKFKIDARLYASGDFTLWLEEYLPDGLVFTRSTLNNTIDLSPFWDLVDVAAEVAA